VALRVGPYAAANATNVKRAAAAANVTGSSGATPNNNPSR
jgi:hypothetical protein